MAISTNAEFYIQDYGTNFIEIVIYADTSQNLYYRVLCRLTSNSGSIIYDQYHWIGANGYKNIRLSNLSSGTSYTFNVGVDVDNDPTGGVTWLGAKTQTTDSGSTSTAWSFSNSYSATYTGSTSFSFSLAAGKVGYTNFKAPSNGTLKVYTTGNSDTYGWLVNSGSIGSNTGSGTNVISASTVYVEDDDSGSGSNFSYSYSVKSGTTYEIDWHNYSVNSSASGTLYIEFTPAQTAKWTFDGSYNAVHSGSGSFSFSLAAGKVGYTYWQALANGTLKVYTTGNSDTYGKLVDSGSINNSTGSGNSVIYGNTVFAQDDDSGTNSNFSFTADVIATVKYEIDWHAYSLNNPASGTLYYKFTPAIVSYTITCKDRLYSSSGTLLSTTTKGTMTYDEGESVSGADWGTSSSYTGYYYQSCTTISSVSGNATVYRNFYPNSYTVSYNVNGGTGTISSTSRYYNEAYNLTPSVPTRQGYKFLGWGTTSNATTYYASGASMSASTSTATITYYAIWKKIENVYFGVNGVWKPCQVYYGVNGVWKLATVKYGANGIWK